MAHRFHPFDAAEIGFVAAMPEECGENYVRSALLAAEKRVRELWRPEHVRAECAKHIPALKAAVMNFNT